MEIEQQIQREATEYQKIQGEYAKAVNNRTQLESQLKENTQVQQEFELMNEGSIFKLIGPVLVKEKEEAKQNVKKRIEYITGEIKRMESLISSLEEKQEKKRMELINLEAIHQKKLKESA